MVNTPGYWMPRPLTKRLQPEKIESRSISMQFILTCGSSYMPCAVGRNLSYSQSMYQTQFFIFMYQNSLSIGKPSNHCWPQKRSVGVPQRPPGSFLRLNSIMPLPNRYERLPANCKKQNDTSG